MNYYQIPIFIAFVSYLWLVFQWIIRGFSMNALCLWSDGVVRLHQQITGERKLLNKMLDYHCDVFIWGDISWPGGHDLHIHDISAHVLLWLHCHHWTEVGLRHCKLVILVHNCNLRGSKTWGSPLVVVKLPCRLKNHSKPKIGLFDKVFSEMALTWACLFLCPT